MESIEIDADTQKMEDKKWYTTKILTLTDENLIKVQNMVKESYIKQFKYILGLN